MTIFTRPPSDGMKFKNPSLFHPMKTTVCLLLAACLPVVSAFAGPPKKGAVVSGKKKVSAGNLNLNIATLPKPPVNTTQTDRDGSGRIALQSYTTPAGTVVTRDSRGVIVATSTTTYAGSTSTTTHRDSRGMIIGNTYKSPTGDETTRDGSGRITHFASTNPSGDTVTYRDANGRIIGTKYTSPVGNITYRNGDGMIVGPNLR